MYEYLYPSHTLEFYFIQGKYASLKNVKMIIIFVCVNYRFTPCGGLYVRVFDHIIPVIQKCPIPLCIYM